MKQLSKADDERRTEEVEKVRDAAQKVRDAIEKVNALIDQANTLIDEEVNPAIRDLNEQRTETGGFVEDLVSTMNDYIDARSDKWRDSDAGQEYTTWKDGYEAIDFGAISEVEHVTRVEDPDDLDTAADELEQQATTPDA